MKRFLAFFLTIIIILPTATVFGGFIDQFIESDPVDRLYSGRQETSEIRFNLMFTDMDEYFWAQEAVTRLGALDMVKGYGNSFFPGDFVSKSYAVGHIMRALGYEWQAIQQLTGIEAQLPPGVPMETLMELSYMYFASSLNIITPLNYQDALYEVRERQALYNSLGAAAAEAFLPDAFAYRAWDPVTREELALLIYLGLQTINTNLWVNPPTVQHLYMFADWTEINPAHLPAVEAMLSNGIMDGYLGNFLPHDYVTRAVMAVILRAMDDIYYGLIGIQKKTGVVAGIIDSGGLETAAFAAERQILVRTSAGLKDVLRFSGAINAEGRVQTLDAIVYKNWEIVGLQALEPGDVIEYLVNPAANQVIYAHVLGTSLETNVEGVLHSVNIPGNQIVLRQIDGNLHTYNFVSGMGFSEGGRDFLIMHGLSGNADGDIVSPENMPISSHVRITLLGNIAVRITYLGEPVVIAQGSGVVLENDPAFGFMTILERGGATVIKRYYENDMVVQKREYYETSDNIGYIAQIFPHFGYNPLITTISAVEPGDLVFFVTDPDDPDVITAISAVTNYTARYGKVISIRGGSGFTEILVEYENFRTAWFSVANKIFVTKDGRPSSVYHLMEGDWVRLLVNEAVIAPGVVTETVKELNIEGPERHISSTVKGNLLRFDDIQWRMIVENAMIHDRARGWTDYLNVETYDLSGRDIEFYNNGARISKDEAARFLRRTDVTVYIALESSFLGERVRMVSFRDSRDTALAPDTVVSATGGGSFGILSQPGSIATDAGTIVVRHGRLVSGRDIYPGDYVSVVLNGEGLAAIVTITDTPGTPALMFARGGVMSVNEGHAGRSFTVYSMSTLFSTQWGYTPVQRIYEIDHRTIFWDEDGFVPPDTFIGYTESTVVDNYYTIVADGTRAAFVVAAPFANGAMRGTVYEIDGDGFGIRDVEYEEPLTGLWRRLPAVDNNVVIRVPGTNTWETIISEYNTLRINTYANTLIARDNSIVTLSDLSAGDQVLIMTSEIRPFNTVALTSVIDGPFTDVDGWIIRVLN
ncbi:MAG: S-layer homology domain-containing protein [Defluviitaleaceae bacterium]|nr:S-layer homology domain-containing protein [Defluviitaleaceae bacterium]MCL2835991.1 S-layer homology domain-containing protein [Defluviitaleaceae bacterium]